MQARPHSFIGSHAPFGSSNTSHLPLPPNITSILTSGGTNGLRPPTKSPSGIHGKVLDGQLSKQKIHCNPEQQHSLKMNLKALRKASKTAVREKSNPYHPIPHPISIQNMRFDQKKKKHFGTIPTESFLDRGFRSLPLSVSLYF